MKKNKISVIGLSGLSFFIKTNKFANVGETVLASDYHIEYGGKGFNQAVAAKRCNPNLMVSFLTCFGDDEIKDEALKILNKENIDTFSIIKKGYKSGSAAIEIDKDGNNKVTCYPGASIQLTKEDVRSFEKEIKESKYLLLQLESSDESLVEAINLASKYDTKVILNPAPAKKLDQDILNKVYLLTPNENEYDLLFGKNELKNNVIKTIGKDGIIANIDGELFNVKPNQKKVINTTGAGDTFNGILASMLSVGCDIKKSIRYAVAGSSLSVTKEFVIDSIPYHDEIIKEEREL